MTSQRKIPQRPNAETAIEDDIPYYDYLVEEGKSITIREFLGYWGYVSRSVNINNRINAAMQSIGFRTVPPIDTGPLDSHILIYKTESDDASHNLANEQLLELANNNHLLTLAIIPSATLCQKENSNLMITTPEESISTALTKMLQHDFSQLPVVDRKSPDTILGIFSWESYGHAMLSGSRPHTVSDAILSSPRIVELRTDLFQSTSTIAQYGFILVTHLGKLSGIVTASDLTEQFEQLAIPFLAVGRAEQELKRVAKILIGEKQKTKQGDEIQVDDMMLGNLQNYYRNNWEKLSWTLDKEIFDKWFDTVRGLRNKIAHFDGADTNISSELEMANRLTQWLQQFKDTQQKNRSIET